MTAGTLAVLALALIAVGLGLHDLTGKSIWTDEVTSSDHVTSGLRSLAGTVAGGDPNMGLYYVLLYGWAKVFGHGEVALRSLSVIFGALCVPALAGLGRRLFGGAVGLLAALLLAVNPFLIQYEQTARGYALVVLLVTLSSYFFVRELQEPSPAGRRGYVLCSAAAVYAHYFAVYVLAAQFLTLLVLDGRQALARPARRGGITVVVLCVPEMAFALRKGTGGISWIPRPHLASIPDLFSHLAGSSELAWLLGALACIGAVAGMRRTGRWRAGLLLVWLLAPVLVTYLISVLGRPLWVPYYLIVVLPAFLLLAARGVAALPLRALGAVALIAFLVLSGSALSDWYRQPSIDGFRGATRYLLARERPGDRIVFDRDYARGGFAYYASLAHRRLPVTITLKRATVARESSFRLWVAIREGDVGRASAQRLESQLRARRGAPLARHESSNLVVILYGPPAGLIAPH